MHHGQSGAACRSVTPALPGRLRSYDDQGSPSKWESHAERCDGPPELDSRIRLGRPSAEQADALPEEYRYANEQQGAQPEGVHPRPDIERRSNRDHQQSPIRSEDQKDRHDRWRLNLRGQHAASNQEKGADAEHR